MSANITGIGTAGSNPVMLGHSLTGSAMDAVRVEVILEPFQTGRIIGEKSVEILDGELLHCCASLPSRDSIAHEIPTVKG